MPPILIIDDDTDIRTTLHALLEDDGYEVFEAANGADGLAFLQTQAPRGIVIVLDYMMPKLDGIGVLNAVRDDRKLQNHRFVMITAAGRAIPPELDALLQLFAVPVVRKPFDFNELMDKIKVALQSIPSPDQHGLPDDGMSPPL